MPRSRRIRGKRKQKDNKHTPTRPLDEECRRLQQAITKSISLNSLPSLSQQAEGSTSLPSAASPSTPPAEAGEAGGGSVSELPKVIPVSIDSDSDHPLSDAESSPFEEDKLIANPSTIVPPTELSLTTKTASDGRIISTISLKKF